MTDRPNHETATATNTERHRDPRRRPPIGSRGAGQALLAEPGGAGRRPAPSARWSSASSPRTPAEWNDPISRRRFLTLMGASLALAGLAGCRAAQRHHHALHPPAREPRPRQAALLRHRHDAGRLRHRPARREPRGPADQARGQPASTPPASARRTRRTRPPSSASTTPTARSRHCSGASPAVRRRDGRDATPRLPAPD